MHWIGLHSNFVWFELPDSMHDAIEQDKHIKEWKCAWKLKLIEKDNPNVNLNDIEA